MKNKKKANLPNGLKGFKFKIYWLYAIIFVFFIGLQFIGTEITKPTNWQEFNQTMLQNFKVEKVVIVNKDKAYVYIKKEFLSEEQFKKVGKKTFGDAQNLGPHFYFEIGSVETFSNDLKDAQIAFDNEDKISPFYETKKDVFGDIIGWILPLAFFVFIWLFIMKKMSGGAGGGGQIFNIGKTQGKLVDKEDIKITFDDVAGLEGAKEEITEIVDFLKSPEKYTKLGGKIPRGAMLIGPPGTGKTLLAKAVAGEAKAPFFSLSGSDFVEMFVGVGASRVRDMFEQGKKNSPCIIFIDEIDAVGRHRGAGLGGGNDEREQTLNQLLVEMDGFSSEKGVIIVAATNRPDVLDNALLRPGRFDRQIGIDNPDLIGREAIFKVHLGPLKIVGEVDASKLASQTPGFAGAEIANVCNEAALIAARKDKSAVEMQDFQDAIDRTIGGLEKKNKIISKEEKKIIAWHEAGHAVVGWNLKHADPLVKVTIVPRGVAALGYAQYLPKEQFLHTRDQMLDSMCMTLGGRAAEDIIFEKISTGAQNDLERITKMAYAMITIYGMNEKVGNVSFNDPKGEYGFGKPYADETAKIIDDEVRNMINEAYERTKALLVEKKDQLEKIALALLETEVLFQSDLEELIGKRPFTNSESRIGPMGEEVEEKTATVVEEAITEPIVTGEKVEEVKSTDQDTEEAKVTQED